MRVPHGYVPTTPLGPAPGGDLSLKEPRPAGDRLRLRIESDGTAHGTHVVELGTGRELPVQAVTWSMDIREGKSNAAATATIVVPLVEVVVAASARVDGGLHFAYPPVRANQSADEKT